MTSTLDGRARADASVDTRGGRADASHVSEHSATWRIRLFAVGLAFLVAACPSSDRFGLTVEVQTGLLPGTEFGYVELAVAAGSVPRGGALTEPRTAGTVARVGSDEFRTGARIHTFESLASGVYTLRARLRRPVRAGEPEDGGTVLVERWVVVSLAAPRVVGVALTSSCLGVVSPAPEGGPGSTGCVNGRCVDPRCDPADPGTASFCCDVADATEDCSVPVACVAATDCTAPGSCAASGCVEGACVETDRPGACPGGTYCARASGTCEPLETPADAGPRDADLVDAATSVPPDAGMDAISAVPDANDTDATAGNDAALDAFDPCLGVVCSAPDACHLGRCMPAPWTLYAGSGAGSGAAYGIARGGVAGDLYVVGSFSGELALPGCPAVSATGGLDIFVARLAAGAPDPRTGIGACVWLSAFGSAGDDEGRAIVMDVDGNIYVTGAIAGDVDFGGGPLTLSGGVQTDLFVASFTPTGAHRWSINRGSVGPDIGLGIAIDPGPSPSEGVVTGRGLGIVPFGLVINTMGGSHTLLGRIDSSTGVPVFGSSATGSSSSAGRGVAVLPLGIPGMRSDVVVTGSFRGRTFFASSGGRLDSAGGEDVFVAVYRGNLGLLDWVEGFGGTGDDAGRAVAVDATSLYVTGDFEGSVRFSEPPSTSTALEDGFVLSLDPTAGAVRWRRVFGTAGDDPTMTRNDSGRGLSVDVTGRLLFAGMGSDRIFWAGGSAASLGACPLGCGSGIAGWLEPDDSDGRLRAFSVGTIAGRDVDHSVVSDGDRLFVAGEREGRVWVEATR